MARRTVEPADLLARALSDARDAAARAGIDVELLDDVDALHDVSALFASIWGTGSDPQVHPDLLRAMVHAGNYAAGAFVDGDLVGGVVGFLGLDGDGPYLHSHILGVSEKRRGRNVGYVLKLHQRAWALEQGLSKVTWTFDPLVRRNAHFNVQKLGATATNYFESFYGTMTDGINAGDESDRLLIEWHLDAAHVAQASSGRLDEPAQDQLVNAVVALSPDGETESTRGPIILCATPDDIVALRRNDPKLALRWRHALRDTLGDAMHDGFSLTGFTRSGWYVLEQDGA